MPKTRFKALIGISCCSKQFGVFNAPNHAASHIYVQAVTEILDGVPVLIPADARAAHAPTLLDRVNGIIFTGSRSNVHPSHYGGPPHPEGVPEDPMRDSTTLPLIRAAITHGVPMLAICRGFQELNVALGGTLHQRLQDLPGRIDHSTPQQPCARVRTGKAHMIRVVPESWLHQIAGAEQIAVNSLHNQGIDRLAPGLVAEGFAPDGTIEAVRVVQAAAFAVGVQWHPEYDYAQDPVSRRIFEGFGAAVRAGMVTDASAVAA
ncbi:MAG: gamma-glutamyl-gamma-aminobutyrate hydrolase family protein [Acetobacteraceae bacterium]|nr:gamma-glutamyl-gamma-aminobutyrate hydrolase family protein [Acetobacteraceae bacterium]MBV8525078.1 gamma-glutamyl-gamma-aminobutyrate hydrolase family protein [Acetobacteraceae bacterium]MBV8592202.1 gamma-glutamyl-gamma-aminobutyrate hydrolase family protein [Acetobacteraceae bacterium]